tara:strand:- start:298 stop:1368 length:1071 start_codon:yes stop_codon:yes gene_type:complete
MRPIALIMSLILLLVPLAGCTGPDGEVTVDITSEELQQLIDDNQEDFLNNTTIVVFEEYHNNTTVVNNNNIINNYNNSTDIDQSGASSSSSSTNTTNIYNGSNGEDIRMFTVQWNPADNVSDPTDNQILRPLYTNCDDSDGYLICNEWDYGYDSILGDNDIGINSYNISTIYVYEYDNQIREITATCSDYWQYYNWEPEDWSEYLVDNYGDGGYTGEDQDVSVRLRNVFDGAPWGSIWFQETCDQNFTEPIILFEIQLEHGTALEFLDYPELIIDVNCEDGFGTGIGNGVSSSLVGGQSNCTVTGSTKIIWNVNHITNWDNDGYQTYSLSWNYEVYYNTPESFAVYFELRPVTVHQ